MAAIEEPQCLPFEDYASNRLIAIECMLRDGKCYAEENIVVKCLTDGSSQKNEYEAGFNSLHPALHCTLLP